MNFLNLKDFLQIFRVHFEFILVKIHTKVFIFHVLMQKIEIAKCACMATCNGAFECHIVCKWRLCGAM